MAQPADRRRAQLPRPDGAAGAPASTYEGIGRREPRPVADDGRLDAGDRPRRRRGNAAAAADPDRAEAGADPGRPPVPRLHDRVARPPRGRRGRPGLRLPARAPARGARRRRCRAGPRSATSRSPSRSAPPARSASPPIEGLLDDRFLALNGDVLTDLDLTALLRAARGDAARCHARRCYPVDDPTRLRPRPPRATTASRARVPREARSGRDRHRRGQRRRLRARALGARPDPRRARRSRSSARSSRGWSARASTAAASTATGWTSAPRERYLQASWDILEGTGRDRARRRPAGSLRRRRRRDRRRRDRRPPRGDPLRVQGRRWRRDFASRCCSTAA